MVLYVLLEVRCEVLPKMLIAHDQLQHPISGLGYLLNKR